MRRILISPYVVQLAEDYHNNLFKKRNANFNKPINSDGISGNLIDLEDFLRIDCNLPLYADYVRTIIDNYSEIITLQPNNFQNYNDDNFNLTPEELSKLVTPPAGNTRFKRKQLYELILDAMRYDAVRDKEYLKYINKIGIKSCIYCNAQFSITTEAINGNLSGKYELDHYFPKSKYPFLSTSFFNLILCCSHCNKSKLNRTALFNLYVDDFNLVEPFSFSLDIRSMLRYLLTQNETELVIIFNSEDLNLKENHEKLFHITELYSQHKDIVEEIIWKSRIYNKSYKDSLSDSFAKLFPNTSNFNRFILGNYDNPKEIHKRPMAKLAQDIGRQLGVI
ncbi:HNH endonuclease [Aquiflexum balticum DSM 16537]|uniref:HNH endonuclease n=1 Tax=Aquiflexum balticum DSM 16537 TaxID=758820 RepID=A0A1W2H5W8_9BACT|nr:HNH endonuclease domain-containing protein [Aquiflexum balticum]SMD44174.1 HNH endonuclease [Aquiflexum balticum DSM 16537]